jgi:Tol biopolymer transport system component
LEEDTMSVNTNKQTLWTTALILIAALLPATLMLAQRNESPEAMLQRAIQKEMVDGDLPAAIDIYEKVVASGASSAVKAQALLNMGRSYEHMGDAEARKVYERVVRDYDGQTEATARARLNALGVETPAGAVSDRGLTQIPGSVFFTGISRDGRYIYRGYGRVYDQLTGEERSVDISTDRIWDAAFSADGRQIAYELFRDGDGSSAAEIRTTSLQAPKGTPGKVLFRNEEFAGARPFGWSPDGREVFAVLTHKDRTEKITAISTNGSVRAIKSLEWRWPTGLSVSPDGRYLVYDAPLEKESSDRDIFLLATDGSTEIPLVTGAGRDAEPIWTPDGNAVVFTSDRDAQPGIWMMEVAGGKPLGMPVKLRAGEGQRPIGLTPDGALYFVTGKPALSTIYTRQVDLEAGTRSSEVPIGPGRGPVSYSPDGKRIAFVRDRSLIGTYPYNVSSQALIIRSLASGEEREIPTAWVGKHRWMLDGQSIFFFGSMEFDPTTRAFHRIDVNSGKVLRDHIPASVAFVSTPSISPDGKKIYYFKSLLTESASLALMAYDIETSRETELTRGMTGATLLEVSPDGQQLVFQAASFSVPAPVVSQSALHIISTSGGPSRRLSESTLSILRWSEDGKSFLTQKSGGELYWISTDGGQPRQDGQNPYPGLSLHPDGKQVVFATRNLPSPSSEVWVDPDVLTNPRSPRYRGGYHLFTVDIDPSSAKVRGSAVQLTQSLVTKVQTSTWSPNGKAILFGRQHKASYSDMVVRSLDTGSESVYPFEPNIVQRFWWYHDSKSLLLASRGVKVHLERLDVESGKRAELANLDVTDPVGQLLGQAFWYTSCSTVLSRDDRTLYVLQSEPTKTPTVFQSEPLKTEVVAIDLTSFKEKYRVGLPVTVRTLVQGDRSCLALSRDDRTLAVLIADRASARNGQHKVTLAKVGIDGKGHQVLYSGFSEEIFRPVWTKDGRGILLATRPSSLDARIMRIPAEGGSPTFTGLEVPGGYLGDFDLSPDGTQIVYAGASPTSATAR